MTAALTVLFLEISGSFVEPGGVIMCRSNIKAFHQLPENSSDVIFYGSSLSWRSIDPLQLYEDYGIGSYNYGANFQNLNTTALFFYDSIRTQKPKIAVFNLYKPDGISINAPVTSEIYYTREIPGFSYKWKYLWSALGPHPLRYLVYMMPVFLYKDRWHLLKSSGYNDNYPPEELLQTMGFFNARYCRESQPVTVPDPSEMNQEPLPDQAAEILDGIVKTCREQGILPLFMIIPNGEENAYADAARDYAEQNGCAYLNMYDYLEEIGIDPDKDYADEIHLNVNGAKKLTSFLGEYLSENYDLQDMRLTQDNPWAGKAGNVVKRVKAFPPVAKFW